MVGNTILRKLLRRDFYFANKVCRVFLRAILLSETWAKNFRSLFYHIPGTGYLNHSRRSIVKPLANTYQFYIWKSKK